jgi:hypothetical protein
MNGRELANWATKKYPRLKVLLTTASEEEASIEQPVSSLRFPAVVKTLQQKRTHKNFTRYTSISDDSMQAPASKNRLHIFT